MSRLSGNFGAQQLGNTQGTQKSAGAKLQEFFVGIGKGLSRAGKAIAHFFGSSVPTFFKSLTSRTATHVATTDGPRSRGAADINNLDFSTAKGFEEHGSGNGGVLFAKVGGSTVVIKGGGAMSANEVLGARLAREVGLTAPDTRLLTGGEKDDITTQLQEHRAEMPKRRDGDSAPTIVMEHCRGKQLGENKVSSKEQLHELAQSLGKWLAFDCIIAEMDRFTSLNNSGATAMNGMNTGNFLVNPSNPGEIIGIDQNVTAGKTSQVMDQIIGGDRSFFRSLGTVLCGKYPQLGMEGDDLADDLMQSAQTMLKHIGTTLTDVKIEQLTGDLPGLGATKDALTQRLGKAELYANS